MKVLDRYILTIVSHFLCFTLGYAIEGDEWNDLKIEGGEIILREDSTLNLTLSPTSAENTSYYGGNLGFEGAKLLRLNLTIQGQTAQGNTPFYWRKTADTPLRQSFVCGKMQGNEGTCTIEINVLDTQSTINRLIDLGSGTLTIDQNIFLTLPKGASVRSLFHSAKDTTLEFDGRFVADLRDNEGTFTDKKITGKRKVVVENYGTHTAINTYKMPFKVQIYGDIISAGQRFDLNLMTADSVFEGNFDIGDSPHYYAQNNITLDNGASAKVKLSMLKATNEAPQRFTMSLSHGSSAKVEALLDRTKYALLDFDVSDSKLWANFEYSALSANKRGERDNIRLALHRGGEWISTKSAYADELYFNVELPAQDKPILPNTLQESRQAPALLSSGSGGVVDLRYRDFEGNLRSYEMMSKDAQIVLHSKKIAGNGGLFRIYGILNRDLWGRDESGNAIATDQIITSSVQGTHSIQIYWDTKNLDPALLEEDLSGDRIVVARQLSRETQGEFVGAKAVVGLLEYESVLKKEDLMKDGEAVGYEWVIGKIPPPTDPDVPPPPRPSFLSKTLNSALGVPYRTWVAQSQTLHQRMGDLRHIDRVAGAYVKTNYTLEHSKESYSEISALSHSYEVSLGGDIGFYSQVGKNFLGGAFSVMPMWEKGEGGAYHGESVAYGFALYESVLFAQGLYMDFLLKYLYASHHYRFDSEDLAGNRLEFSTHAFLGAFEMGYKLKLPIRSKSEADFYYLKPQLNFQLGYLLGMEGMRLEHSRGFEVGADLVGSLPLQTALGVDMGKRFDSEELRGDLFVSLGGEYTFNAGNTIKLQTPMNETSFVPKDIFNLKLAVGGNVILNSGSRFYLEVGSKFVGRVAPVLSLNAGARIPLGEHYPNLTRTKIQFPLIYGRKRRD